MYRWDNSRNCEIWKRYSILVDDFDMCSILVDDFDMWHGMETISARCEVRQLLWHFTKVKEIRRSAITPGLLVYWVCRTKYMEENWFEGLIQITEEKVCEEQGGFRKGKSCVGQIFATKILVGEYLGKDKKLYVAFID